MPPGRAHIPGSSLNSWPQILNGCSTLLGNPAILLDLVHSPMFQKDDFTPFPCCSDVQQSLPIPSLITGDFASRFSGKIKAIRKIFHCLPQTNMAACPHLCHWSLPSLLLPRETSIVREQTLLHHLHFWRKLSLIIPSPCLSKTLC